MMGDGRALHQATPQQQPIQAQAQRDLSSFKQQNDIAGNNFAPRDAGNWGWQASNNK